MAAARYGHAAVLRELISKYGCNKNATKRVCDPYFVIAVSSAWEHKDGHDTQYIKVIHTDI